MAGDYLFIKTLEKLFAPVVKKQVTNLIESVLKAWKNKDNPPLGACYLNPKPGDDFWELLDAGFRNAHNIKILCSTGYTTYGPGGENKLAPALHEKMKGELQFLLLNPQSTEIMDRRVKELPKKYGYTKDLYKREILSTQKVIRKLHKDKDYNPKIELRYFHHYPTCRVFIFDNIIAFVQQYLPGKLGDLSPVVAFKKTNDHGSFSMFLYYLQYFDKTFEFGKDALKQT